MSFYPAKGGGKEKEIQVLALQNAGLTYWDVSQGTRSKYTFTKAYKNALVLFNKADAGGEIDFTGCDYEKVTISTDNIGGSNWYKLTNIQSGATISCYTFSNGSGSKYHMILGVFVQD